ncbi:uncharacterized protein PSANT_02868 [Moesziomyces antarcticus]|nr:uncharacterized protein PSANT_02868 [Moesziomyces antarcticus]
MQLKSYGDFPRTIDLDPFFDNTKLVYGDAGTKVPYTPQNTWTDPNGSAKDYLEKTKGLTTLQKHVAYFDGDCDGVIWPSDTFFGFLAMGFGIFLSAFAMLAINGAMSYPTLPRNSKSLRNWLPDPYMRIYVANMHRSKHGSDTESFDRRGQFRQSQLEAELSECSSRYGKDALSYSDVLAMFRERRDVFDLFGMTAFLLEWSATYMLIWPADGYMRKDDILGVYDGSLFVVLAHRYKNGLGGGAFDSKKGGVFDTKNG